MNRAVSNPAQGSSRGRSGTVAIVQAERAFPNLSVALLDDRADRAIYSRMIADHAITHLVTPRSVVDACGRTADRAGFGRHFKLIWQLAGTMRYEDRNRSFALRAGEMMITPMARSYRLEMGERYEGLVLVFDPKDNRSWREAAHRETCKAIPASSAIAAAAGGAAALLRHGCSDSTDAITVRSLLDIALASLGADRLGAVSERPTSAALVRARLMVAENIADEDYGPEQLARDLGLSRRSLYNSFGRIGLTPGSFIRQQRLERARAEILGDTDPGLNLVTIALRNGFPDSPSFSRAFKAAYGISPSQLRASRTFA